MASVLILGASLLQKPAIEAALKMGVKTFVVDANERSLCAAMAGVHFQKIDLRDKEGILCYAKKLLESEGLKGVFTAGTDFSSSVAFVTERLGLFGHSYDAALNATDKARMRAKFLENFVPSPAFFVCKSLDDAKNAARALQFPFVAKPADNMGARGCVLVRGAADLEGAFFGARDASKSQTAIFEEYMAGDEYSLDALVAGEEVTITGFALRDIQFPPHFIEMGHTIGNFFELGEKKQKLIEVFARGVKALGLSWGAAKGDMKWVTGRGAMVGEIAGRLSGGYMSGWTYPKASGFPLTRAALKMSMGEQSEELIFRRVSLGEIDGIKIFEVQCEKYAAERALIGRDGVLKEVHYTFCGKEVSMEEWKKAYEVEEYFLRPVMQSLPAKVFSPRDNTQKLSNVICTGSTFSAATEKAKRAIEAIKLIYE